MPLHSNVLRYMTTVASPPNQEIPPIKLPLGSAALLREKSNRELPSATPTKVSVQIVPLPLTPEASACLVTPTTTVDVFPVAKKKVDPDCPRNVPSSALA